LASDAVRRWLAVLLLFGCWHASDSFAVENRYPALAQAYLVEVGEKPLWAGGTDKRLPPASLTKLMTALLVLEDYRPQEWATVSRRAAAAEGSRLGLRAGTRMRVDQLLAAALVRSANDACAVLAEHYGGSEAAFVARMNRRAEELGLRDTHFANACGFDAPEHYSSVRDLASLARQGMRFTVFAETVKKKEIVVTDGAGKRYSIRNTNALVGTYPGAIGVKSGYTRGAGRCIAALVERDGVQVWLVMLNARDRWWDAVGVVENAFDQAQIQR
jgi:serine-type D-Ala-D-Ala carboxypeptidase (penicillin-binding protein 5/6)